MIILISLSFLYLNICITCVNRVRSSMRSLDCSQPQSTSGSTRIREWSVSMETWKLTHYDSSAIRSVIYCYLYCILLFSFILDDYIILVQTERQLALKKHMISKSKHSPTNIFLVFTYISLGQVNPLVRHITQMYYQ